MVFSNMPQDLSATGGMGFTIANGVGIHCMAIFVGCIVFNRLSGCKAVIGGPDLLPIIFALEASKALEGEIAPGKIDQQLLPSSLVAMIIGNVITGVLFLTVGRLKRASATVGKIPKSVICGFLSCIGYKVVKLAVYVSASSPSKTIQLKASYWAYLWKAKPEEVDPWIPMLLSLLVGVPLWIAKDNHGWGRIRVDLLLMLFIVVPFALFHIVAALSSAANGRAYTLDHERETGWLLFDASGWCDDGGAGSGSGSHPSGSGSGGHPHGNHSSGHGSSGVHALGASASGSGSYTAPSVCPFPPYPAPTFYTAFEVAYGDGDSLAWPAFTSCVGIWLMGSCLTLLDNVLKLASSEAALGVEFNMDDELQVGGVGTLISAVLVASPTYGQTKFNAMNKGIVGSVTRGLPTLVCGFTLGFLYFTGFSGFIIAACPRFLLGGLMVYSGAGFLVDNLYRAHRQMSTFSFGIVWVIFLVNFVWEFFIKEGLPPKVAPYLPGLLVVFVLGCFLALIEFLLSYYKHVHPSPVIFGDQVTSLAVRPPKQEAKLATMSPWFQVFKLEGFVFIATADVMYQDLKAHFAMIDAERPPWEKTKVTVVDLSGLTGLDVIALTIFTKLRRFVLGRRCGLMWVKPQGVDTDVDLQRAWEHFVAAGLCEGTHTFDTRDDAIKATEDLLLGYESKLTQAWTHDAGAKTIYRRAVVNELVSNGDATSLADRGSISPFQLLRYSTKLSYAGGDVIFEEGATGEALYLVFCGEVLLQESASGPTQPVPITAYPGTFFNERAMYCSPLSGTVFKATAIGHTVCLRLTQRDISLLMQASPALGERLMLKLLRQREQINPARKRPRPESTGGTLHAKPTGGAEVAVQVVGTSQPKRTPPSLLALLRTAASLDESFFAGADYKVELSPDQLEHYAAVFGALDIDGSGELECSEITLLIHEMGNAFTEADLGELLRDTGQDKDGNGKLSLPEFIEFVRLSLVADLPKARVDEYTAAFRKVPSSGIEKSAKDPQHVIHRDDLPKLMASLGFDPQLSLAELLSQAGVSQSSTIALRDFLFVIGALKKRMVDLQVLRESWRLFVAEQDPRSPTQPFVPEQCLVSAVDVQRALTLTHSEAQDLIFIANQGNYGIQGEPAMSFADFVELVAAQDYREGAKELLL